MASPGLERYLTRYGLVDELPRLQRRYRFVLTVPAFDEAEDFLDRVLEHISGADVLAILTINVPDNAEAGARERTAALLDVMRQRADVIAIDRVGAPIPRRQGVGMARKLAMDLAAALILQGDVACPVIFMTDADVTLPDGYFEAAQDLDAGTVLYPFRHQADDPLIRLKAETYELHLRHYVSGLARAGSPYAFQTLGSTIAIHAETYARIRGVPRRNAGEDFYLLNKAAKVDPIISLGNPEIVIHARPSSRVPFGTGPALFSMPDSVEEFVSYPEDVFDELRRALTSLEAWSLEGARQDPSAYLLELGWDPTPFEAMHPPGLRRLRAALEWFDGFRAMRFVRLGTRDRADAPLLETVRSKLASPQADPGELLALLRAVQTTRTLGVGEVIRTLTANPV
jgi:hypothetical protein